MLLTLDSINTQLKNVLTRDASGQHTQLFCLLSQKLGKILKVKRRLILQWDYKQIKAYIL